MSEQAAATHTPGPWRQDEPGSLLVVAGEAKHATDIVAGCWGHSDVRYAEGVANARLISAAPDLLAALKAEIDTHGHLSGRCAVPAGADGCSARCEVVRAAIAKAEGRTL